jgi:hypothetical protein
MAKRDEIQKTAARIQMFACEAGYKLTPEVAVELATAAVARGKQHDNDYLRDIALP